MDRKERKCIVIQQLHKSQVMLQDESSLYSTIRICTNTRIIFQYYNNLLGYPIQLVKGNWSSLLIPSISKTYADLSHFTFCCSEPQWLQELCTCNERIMPPIFTSFHLHTWTRVLAILGGVWYKEMFSVFIVCFHFLKMIYISDFQALFPFTCFPLLKMKTQNAWDKI